MTTVVEIRKDLASRRDCEFISAAEFVTHLTCHTQLERCDEPIANLFGLKHPSTGRTFFVPVEELARVDLKQAPYRI